MNQNATIDSIFKNQLEQMEQPGADENWRRLEKELLAQQKKKRRAGAWLLGLLLLLGGGAALVWGLTDNGKADGAAVASAIPDNPAVKKAIGTAQSKPETDLSDGANTVPTEGTDKLSGTDNAPTSNATANPGTNNGNRSSFSRKARQRITVSSGDIATDETAETKRNGININKKGSQKVTVQNVSPVTVLDETAAEATKVDATTFDKPIVPVTAQETSAAEVTATPKTEEQAEKKKPEPTEPVAEKQAEEVPAPTAQKAQKHRAGRLQLELAAGADVSNGLSDAGKYGMAMLRLPLNKKANLLLGAGYAENKMTEGYKQADKPNLLNREVDAKLRGLNMLQFPILYEQAIKENKLLFRAGITPVYVLDAAIVNIPNSFSGNPTNFRTFTLNDINRFNVLFTAGLQLRFTPRLGLELKGNYGLTELVKNSYINQSGENNNFKSAQVGLLFMIGRKR